MGRGLSQQPQQSCSGIADFAAVILAAHTGVPLVPEEVDERLLPVVAVDVRLEPERDELVEQRGVFDSHQSPRGEPRL
jgi:hypothetical protein